MSTATTSPLVGRPTPGSVHAAAAALAAGTTTASALADQVIARYRQVDAKVHGFLHFDSSALKRDAQAADARRAAGQARGPYDGIPLVIKDNIAVTGQPCGCGSKILAGFTATYDATVVARLKAAGFLCHGRANMDEFAMGSSTENSGYGVTRNPYDPECVPGGSSGGSAAVVASGQAFAALGSDTGGSIRQPAGFCGVVGLKPTYGRVSRFGLVAYASSLDQIGPLTADVQDAAILLDVIGGQDPRDCTSLPTPAGGFAAALAAGDLATMVRGLRVGVPKEYFDTEGLQPEVKAAAEQTLARLQAGGAVLVPVSLPTTKYAVATYYVIATAEASSNLARFDGIRYGHRAADAADIMETYTKSRRQGFGAEVKRRIILGTFVLSSGYHDAYYLQAQKVRTIIRREFTETFQRCDVILSPVAPTTAFRLGAITDPLQMYLSDIYTIPVNLAGNCALSLPVGHDRAGLPIGVQLIGDALAEATILKTAYWLEQTATGGK